MTEEDRAAIEAHLSDPTADVRRQRNLSLGYATAATLFMGAALMAQSAWLALPVWGMFLLWLWLRMRSLRKRNARMTRILQGLEKDGG